jgi:hypothetical protein
MPEELERDSKKEDTTSLIREKNDPDGKAIETGLILSLPARTSFQGKMHRGLYPHAP